MANVTVDRLVVKYGGVTAVDGISFDVPEGGFAALLGPSGCGKTSTLRAIAGLEPVTSGSIHIGGKAVADGRTQLPPERRGVNMVFQSYAVWPHLTVFENVAYGLRVRRMKRAQLTDAVNRILDVVGLRPYAERYGTELSGGQQQRVAVARAVVTEPDVLLFDEPLSNLDAALRTRMRGELRDLQQAIGRTAVYVTHDQQEAMAIADVIILMNNGYIEQVGTGEDLYAAPRTAFVARFIGTANLWPGTIGRVLPAQGGYVVRLDDGRTCATAVGGVPGLTEGEAVEVVVRPEDFHLSVGGDTVAADNSWVGTVESRTYLGNVLELRVRFGDALFHVDANSHLPVRVGDDVTVAIDPARVVCVRRPKDEGDLPDVDEPLLAGTAPDTLAGLAQTPDAAAR